MSHWAIGSVKPSEYVKHWAEGKRATWIDERGNRTTGTIILVDRKDVHLCERADGGLDRVPMHSIVYG